MFAPRTSSLTTGDDDGRVSRFFTSVIPVISAVRGPPHALVRVADELGRRRRRRSDFHSRLRGPDLLPGRKSFAIFLRRTVRSGDRRTRRDASRRVVDDNRYVRFCTFRVHDTRFKNDLNVHGLFAINNLR